MELHLRYGQLFEKEILKARPGDPSPASRRLHRDDPILVKPTPRCRTAQSQLTRQAGDTTDLRQRCRHLDVVSTRTQLANHPSFASYALQQVFDLPTLPHPKFIRNARFDPIGRCNALLAAAAFGPQLARSRYHAVLREEALAAYLANAGKAGEFGAPLALVVFWQNVEGAPGRGQALMALTEQMRDGDMPTRSAAALGCARALQEFRQVTPDIEGTVKAISRSAAEMIRSDSVPELYAALVLCVQLGRLQRNPTTQPDVLGRLLEVAIDKSEPLLRDTAAEAMAVQRVPRELRLECCATLTPRMRKRAVAQIRTASPELRIAILLAACCQEDMMPWPVLLREIEALRQFENRSENVKSAAIHLSRLLDDQL